MAYTLFSILYTPFTFISWLLMLGFESVFFVKPLRKRGLLGIFGLWVAITIAYVITPGDVDVPLVADILSVLYILCVALVGPLTGFVLSLIFYSRVIKRVLFLAAALWVVLTLASPDFSPAYW